MGERGDSLASPGDGPARLGNALPRARKDQISQSTEERTRLLLGNKGIFRERLIFSARNSPPSSEGEFWWIFLRLSRWIFVASRIFRSIVCESGRQVGNGRTRFVPLRDDSSFSTAL